MPQLHLLRRLGPNDQEGDAKRALQLHVDSILQQLGGAPPGAARLPARRRPARPLLLDPPAHPRGVLPGAAERAAAGRRAQLHRRLLAAVPVLLVRDRLPGLDEGGEECAEGEQQERVWLVALRGA